jgi:hypothetical protein
LPFHQLESDTEPFPFRQDLKGLIKIYIQVPVTIFSHLSVNLWGIEVIRHLMTPAIIIPDIISNPVKPGGEMRQPPEFPDIQITFDKGFLSQVITQRAISERLAQEKTPHGRLVLHDQSVK